jgi:hypothetical protein
VSFLAPGASRAIVLAAAAGALLAACGQTSTPAAPSPGESSVATITPAATASPSSATASPTSATSIPANAATKTWVRFSGAHSGYLTDLKPECSNQYLGVQVDGTLDGASFELEVFDPADQVTPGNLTLYDYATKGGVWEGGAPGITSYTYATGATFDTTLNAVTSSGLPASSVVDVTGAILC